MQQQQRAATAAYNEASGSQNDSNLHLLGQAMPVLIVGCIYSGMAVRRTVTGGTEQDICCWQHYATPEHVLANMKNDLLELNILPRISHQDQEWEKNVSTVRSTEHARQILDGLECTRNAGNILQPNLLYAFIADLRWSDMSSLKAANIEKNWSSMGQPASGDHISGA